MSRQLQTFTLPTIQSYAYDEYEAIESYKLDIILNANKYRLTYDEYNHIVDITIDIGFTNLNTLTNLFKLIDTSTIGKMYKNINHNHELEGIQRIKAIFKKNNLFKRYTYDDLALDVYTRQLDLAAINKLTKRDKQK